ncbi:hypothetical protein BU15DRAFT_15191, partial [Melanogaster broomeanus]
LKQSYHAVVDLKNASGFMYSDTLGAGITTDAQEIWARYVKLSTFYLPLILYLTMSQSHPTAKPFRNKGFPHFDDVEKLI